uniref:Protein wos2 n=1 Tax=Cacopsylla melanoneura TaxID=428564 RepID=A0A8D8XRM6_9HEMI
MTQIPPVIWAQRKDKIFITYCVENVKDPKIDIEASEVKFDAVASDKKHYSIDIKLFKEINPEKSTKTVSDRQIELVLKKQEDDTAFWPYLTKEKQKNHWLKVDFNKWVDEDEDDEEFKQTRYSSERENSEFQDKADSEEDEGDLNKEDEDEHEQDEVEETTNDDDEGAGIAIKFGVGVALIVVAHVVLVRKWKENIKPDIPSPPPSAPLPPSQAPPMYVEEISPLPPVEEEELPPPTIDRRATLVEPGEVVLPPSSDVEESDFGEYEEEVDEEEEEEELSQSDIEPVAAQESTLVTYEYSPAESEQEEEEVSENSAPINDKWSAVTSPPAEFNSEDEDLIAESGSDVEYSDNEPPAPVPQQPQTRFGGAQSAEEHFEADILNEQVREENLMARKRVGLPTKPRVSFRE